MDILHPNPRTAILPLPVFTFKEFSEMQLAEGNRIKRMIIIIIIVGDEK